MRSYLRVWLVELSDGITPPTAFATRAQAQHYFDINGYTGRGTVTPYNLWMHDKADVIFQMNHAYSNVLSLANQIVALGGVPVASGNVIFNLGQTRPSRN